MVMFITFERKYNITWKSFWRQGSDPHDFYVATKVTTNFGFRSAKYSGKCAQNVCRYNAPDLLVRTAFQWIVPLANLIFNFLILCLWLPEIQRYDVYWTHTHTFVTFICCLLFFYLPPDICSLRHACVLVATMCVALARCVSIRFPYYV